MADISTAAVTLAEHAIRSKDPLQEKLTKSFLSEVSILDDLPLVTKGMLKVSGGRMTEAGLPTVGYGKLNAAPNEIKTTTERYEESVVLVRAKMQVDRALINDPMALDDPVDTQIQGAVEAHRYQFNNDFFNNDPYNGGDPDGPAGIRARLRNPARFKVANGLRIDAGGINMRTTMTAAQANDFFEKLAQVFAYLGSSDGKGIVAYSNWQTLARVERAIRLQNAGAGFSQGQDGYDRSFKMFRQCKFVDIGFTKAGTDSPIISATQTADGLIDTGSGFTSIVFVRYGDRYFKGWQTGALKPENLGRSTENGTYNNILLDWGFGFVHAHNRSFAELYNLQLS